MSILNPKSAFVFLNENAAARSNPQRTYICIGVARGGTSAVAGAMQRLGVFIGDGLANNYEDPAFLNHISDDQMRQTIAARNAAHPVWGWKNPNAADPLERLLPDIRNPHLIVVTRDLVATMRAQTRWHKRGHLYSAHEIMLQQQRNWFLAERWKLPTALISYEKMILDPKRFVSEFAYFLGMPKTKPKKMQDIAEFLAPGSYK